MIDRMIRIVQTEAPWSFGYYPRQAAALHGWVKNAKPTQTVRDNVQYMAVDAKARAEKIRAWNTPVLWPALIILLAAGLLVWAVRNYVRARRSVTGRIAEGNK